MWPLLLWGRLPRLWGKGFCLQAVKIIFGFMGNLRPVWPT